MEIMAGSHDPVQMQIDDDHATQAGTAPTTGVNPKSTALVLGTAALGTGQLRASSDRESQA